MRLILYVLLLIPSLLLSTSTSFAETVTDSVDTASDDSAWIEDADGDLLDNEFRKVDPMGAVTRRPCPYTCAMRKIPKNHCKEWKSITHAVDGECYVQDLRISKGDAMPINTKDEAAKTTSRYK